MKSRKQWGLWLGLAIVIVFSLLALSSSTSRISVDGPLPPVAGITATDHTKGNPEAQVVLIEYGDYQCPACAIYSSLVSELLVEFSDTVVFAYRHFPLRSIHFNADISAQAAEAAGLQGKFWEMHELLYSRQTQWEKSFDAKNIFTSYAKELGLNTVLFVTDMNSIEVKTRVETDFQSGVKAGINSTPTFYINGRQLASNPAGLEAFRALIQAELTK